MVIRALAFIVLLFCISSCASSNESKPENKTENKAPKAPNKESRSEFLINAPSQNQIIIDLPQMLQLSQPEIEKRMGHPVESSRDGDKEERIYSMKSSSAQVKVAFGYFRGKPSYGRLHLPVAQASSYEAMKLAGIDIGSTPPRDTSTVVDYWYRGEYKKQIYDIRVVRGHSDQVDRVLLEIYLPDEIIKDAESKIAEGERGDLGKLDVERSKNKLKTITIEDKNYNRAQELINKIDNILPRLSP